MNVLYLSYDGMTDPLGQSQVLPYLVGLTKKGVQFDLISFEKPDRFAQHEATIRKICQDNNISWHPQSYTKRPPLLSTLWDVRRMKQLAHRLHTERKFKIVHCRSYLSAMVGLRMQRKFGTKFLFDMRGFWADERIEGGIWSMGNPLFKTVYKFFKRKEIEFFNSADAIVSLTHNGKAEIESWPEVNHRKGEITVIPCCVDLELFDPAKISATKQDELREALGIAKDHKVLGYVGSIGTWYMLDEMLDYFKVQLTVDPAAVFLFVTGENPETILQEARQKGIDEEKLRITRCLHQDVPLHVSLFTQSIFFIRPSFSKKASSPTKQGELMAMGIPIVCNAGVGDTDKVIYDYHAGTVISSFDSDTYLEAVKNEHSSFSSADSMKGAEEFYGLETGVERYWGIYQGIGN